MSDRRTFVKGLMVGGAAAGSGLWQPSVWGQTARQPVRELAGTSFDLSAAPDSCSD